MSQERWKLKCDYGNLKKGDVVNADSVYYVPYSMMKPVFRVKAGSRPHEVRRETSEVRNYSSPSVGRYEFDDSDVGC